MPSSSYKELEPATPSRRERETESADFMSAGFERGEVSA